MSYWMKINGKDIKFARFGGLSSVKQKGYSKGMETFHTPPCKRGFYAFLHPYYEPFLLGGTEYSGLGTKHSKFERIKDKNGNNIKVGDDMSYEHSSSNWMKYWGLHMNNKDGTYDIIKPKKPKVFEYKGELWHHLGEHLNPGEILKNKGSWYLTDFNSYAKALKKEFTSKKIKLKQEIGIETNNPFSEICIDHLEVFIEKM